jgi:hypothetical protein
MPNGSPGDDPINDILVHEREVYSPLASTLIRQIAALADDKTRRALRDVLGRDYNVHFRPDIAKLEHYLTELHNRLMVEAQERGFELNPE